MNVLHERETKSTMLIKGNEIQIAVKSKRKGMVYDMKAGLFLRDSKKTDSIESDSVLFLRALIDQITVPGDVPMEVGSYQQYVFFTFLLFSFHFISFLPFSIYISVFLPNIVMFYIPICENRKTRLGLDENEEIHLVVSRPLYADAEIDTDIFKKQHLDIEFVYDTTACLFHFIFMFCFIFELFYFISLVNLMFV